jgi:hypothetical protein
MAATNFPIYNQPQLYVNNCQLVYGSNTTMTVTAGQVRDSNNSGDLLSSSTLTVNIAKNGANGLDQGTVAASTWYAIYLIADSSGYLPISAIFSTSFTNPLMPKGYTLSRRIGCVPTNESSNFLKIYYYGNNSSVRCFYDAPNLVLNSGSAASYTPVSCSAFVPTVSNVVDFMIYLTPSSDSATGIALRPTGSVSASNIDFWQTSATGGISSTFVQFNVGNTQSIDYLIQGTGTSNLYVYGFEDYL